MPERKLEARHDSENYEDDDSDDLTEEQKKQKRLQHLKKKPTIDIDFGGGKKPHQAESPQNN